MPKIDQYGKTILALEHKALQNLPIKDVENALFEAVRTILTQLQTDENLQIKTDNDIVKILSQVEQAYSGALGVVNWAQTVKDFLVNFDEIAKNTYDLHQSVNGLSEQEIKAKLGNSQTNLLNKAYFDLTDGGLKSYFTNQANTALLHATAFGWSIKQVENELRKKYVSNAQNNSYINAYLTQVARDSVHQYQGQINQIVSDGFELPYIRYVGSLIDDSRPICMHCLNALNGVIERKNLKQLIAQYLGKSGGMIKGTNETNFLVYRGGWNCRHQAIPVRVVAKERNSLNKIENVQLKEKRLKAKEEATKNIIDKKISIKRKEFPKSITFTMKGLKESINQPHKYYLDKLSLIENNLIETIKNAEFVSSVLNKKENKQNILKYHFFSFELNKEKSFIVIEENKQGEFVFYSIVEEIKK